MKRESFRQCLQFALIILCLNYYSVNINAEETSQPVTTIQVELNSDNVATEIITKLVDLKIKEANRKSIIIDQSELKIEGFDSTKLGIQDVTINLNLKTNGLVLVDTVFSEKIKIEVVDTTAPEIILKYPKIKLDFEEELDPYEWVDHIIDNNVITALNLEVDTSSLDISTAGTYTVIYSTHDQSGNESSTEMTVEVKPKKVAYSYYGTNSTSISDMLIAINQVREDNGLSALELGDENAQAAAGVRACEAASNISHTRPDGSHYKTAFDDFGVTYAHPYEIMTYSGTSVADKLKWWMNSPGHKAIVLRKSGEKIAIGYCGKMWLAIVYN